MPQKPIQLDECLKFFFQSKVLKKSEVDEQYDSALIDFAVEQRYITSVDSPIGRLFFLNLRGRRYMGLAGKYVPSLTALLNTVMLRKVKEHLINQGYQISETSRRFTCLAERSGERFCFVARYTGFARCALLRMQQSLAEWPDIDNLKVYTLKKECKFLEQSKWSNEALNISFCDMEI